MPQLKTFTADIGPVQTPSPRASREELALPGAGALGRGTQKFGESLLADTEEQESRKALIQSSELRAKYARALDEAATSGADTAKLKEDMQNEFSKVGENFQTRKGSESLQLHAANTDLMFDEQANRIRITRAASEARLEGHKFLNSASEVIRSNPLYLKAAEQDADAFAATLKNIAPEKRAEIAHGLKQELNMAAAVASARLDPEATKKKLDAGEWNLTPAQREQATQRADSEVRSRRAEDAYIRAEQERQVREADDKARDTHFADIMSGSATRRSIMDDADLRAQTREHLIVFMEHRAKELAGQEKNSDPITKRDLWLRIHAPEADPRKIYNGDAIFEAVNDGKLNTRDANELNTLVAGQKDEQGRSFGARLQGRIATVAGAMRTAPEYQAQPELAAAIQLELVSRVEKKAAELRRSNTPVDGLLDPESKDYMFTPGFMKSIAADVKQRMTDALPKAVDLRVKPDAWRDVADGSLFVDPKGVTRTMTPALKAALGKQAPVEPGKPAPASALDLGVPN